MAPVNIRDPDLAEAELSLLNRMLALPQVYAREAVNASCLGLCVPERWIPTPPEYESDYTGCLVLRSGGSSRPYPGPVDGAAAKALESLIEALRGIDFVDDALIKREGAAGAWKVLVYMRFPHVLHRGESV